MPSGPRPPSSLRLLTQRIAETPPEQLYYHAPSLITLLEQLRVDAGRRQSASGSGPFTPDETVPLHKFKTQVSALLQSKQSESRWLGVILVKVYLEIAGFDALQSSGPWVRTIAEFPGHKNEHSTVKRASIITLTKIFFMSYGHPNLVREITTPVLQPFITHCLTAVGSGQDTEYRIHCRSEVLNAVLQCFILLLPRHPASFRPHVSGIRLILSRLIAPVSLRGHFSHISPDSSALGRRLLSLLPNCAPKNGAAEEWSKNFQAVLQHASRTADHILRAVEGGDMIPSTETHYASVRNFGDTVSDKITDILGLQSWQGISEGVDRLAGCFRILEAFIATSSQNALALPISRIWNLLRRVLSSSGPFVSADGETISPPTNVEVGRDEREYLWAHFPWLHEIAFDILSTLLQRLGSLAFTLADQILENVAWVFEREGEHRTLRLTLYGAASLVISIIGPSLNKDNIAALRPLLTCACSDGQSSPIVTTDKASNSVASKAVNGSILGQSHSAESSHFTNPGDDPNSPLRIAALRLLGDFVARVHSNSIPRALRANIDKTIILAQDEHALIASVLNPDQRTVNGKQTSSNLPFLSRAYPASDAVEALIRPRLPVIRGSSQENGDAEMELDDWDYKRDDSRHSGLEHPSPISHGSQSHASRSGGATDNPKSASMDQAIEEPILSPKRPRETGLDVATVGATTPEPSQKRVREADTAPVSFGKPSHLAADGNEPEVTAQVDVRDFDSVAAKHGAEEDFEIPPIQMPSDFEDTDEDEEIGDEE